MYFFPYRMQKLIISNTSVLFCEIHLLWSVFLHIAVSLGNSYSASRDNWCTSTLWNRIMAAQCEGMGEVGSARYEPALLPPCPSTRVLSYSNCPRSTHSSSRAWQCKCETHGLQLISTCMSKSLMAKWLEQVFQWHEVQFHPKIALHAITLMSVYSASWALRLYHYPFSL